MRAIDAENIRIKPEFMHNVCGMAMIRVEDVVRILNDQPTIQPAEPKKREMNIEQEKMIVEALPSLYPLKDYEEDAIHTVLEALPHWIPVTERLPDNSRNVLITHKGGVSMGWYNGLYFEKGASTHHRKIKTVTAWCELPEAYKGVKNDNI